MLTYLFKLSNKIFSLLIPNNYNLIICQKNYITIYYYSNIYIYAVAVNKVYLSNVIYINFSNTIYFLFNIFYFNYKFYRVFKIIYFSCIQFFFNKFFFKGKGFYIFKNMRNTVAPRFGKSHRIYLYLFNSLVLFLSKTKILLFGINKYDTILNSYRVFFIRPINIFTLRGIRFAKQLLYKKKLVIS